MQIMKWMVHNTGKYRDKKCNISSACWVGLLGGYDKGVPDHAIMAHRGVELQLCTF